MDPGSKVQLVKRLVASAALVALSLAAIFLAPRVIFFLVVEVIILIGAYEYFTIVQRKGIVINLWTAMFFAGLVPFFMESRAISLVLAATVLTVLMSHFRPALRKHALISTSVVVFGVIYVSWFMAHLISIHGLERGPWWVFYILLIVKGGDGGAYFFGKAYGKTKLIEHISPNKSVEGAIAGLLTTVVLSLILSFFVRDIAVVHFIILAILLGVLAQVGDLGESLLKRDIGVKDSGHLPGLGGVLDVLDSLILTVPCLYYYLTLILGVS